MSGANHPTPETVDIYALLREYEAAVENREADERNQGTRGRVNRAAADLVTAVEGLRQSERYAWKNTREIDAERMAFLASLTEARAMLCQALCPDCTCDGTSDPEADGGCDWCRQRAAVRRVSDER